MNLGDVVCRSARRALNALRRLLDRCCERRTPIEHDSTQISHACQVLLYACRARNRALAEERDRAAQGEQVVLTNDSITAIVLAAAATEAFINEFAEMIGLQRQNAADWDPPTSAMSDCADAIFDVEFARGSTVDKYLAASKALGYRFGRGAAPFQAFEQLFDLRSALMHIKPTRAGEKHSGRKITDNLAQRGLAIDAAAVAGLSWFDRLHTPRVAAWACDSALAVILAIEDMVANEPGAIPQRPESIFRRHVGLQSTHWL